MFHCDGVYYLVLALCSVFLVFVFVCNETWVQIYTSGFFEIIIIVSDYVAE